MVGQDSGSPDELDGRSGWDNIYKSFEDRG
jgi:hypothetical protein